MVNDKYRLNGVIRDWKFDRGFGFISSPDLDDPGAKEYFVHCKEVEGYTDACPPVRYQTVSFLPITTLKNGEVHLRAVQVRVEHLEVP